MPLFVDASLSVLANCQASSDQNSKHRTLDRSQIHVCRYPFMAGSRRKHFLQIFIHTTLPEMVAGTFFTVPQCLSTSRQQQRKQPPPECLFPNPSRLNSPATAWTQLSDAFILFCGSTAAMVGWLICRETQPSCAPVTVRGRAEWRRLVRTQDLPADKSVCVTHCYCKSPGSLMSAWVTGRRREHEDMLPLTSD